MTEPDTVIQRWAYMSGMISRHFYEDVPARASFERAERLNSAERAVREGFVPVPGAAVDVRWLPLEDVELEMMSRVARDLDGRISEPEWVDKPDADVEAEERRRKEALRGSARMRVEFDVYATPEKPELRSIALDTHAVLAGQGAQVLADRDASVLLCGGALRRHKFPPREAAWMRDGAVEGARCMDCGQRVTRVELLERQLREEQHGTCVTCGDALDMPPGAVSRLEVVCPTCTAAGRE